MPTIQDAFATARRCGVPLMSIRTPDQQWTQEKTVEKDQPAVRWDAAVGLTAINERGTKALAALGNKVQKECGFIDAMLLMGQMTQGSVCYVHNAHRQLQSAEPLSIAGSVQVLSNLRDLLKKNYRAVVLLGPEGFVMPPELAHDVVTLNHALPGPEELETIIKDIDKAARQSRASIPPLTAETLRRAVDAVRGLSGFEAEQSTAMSYTGSGVNLDTLWESKRVAIEQTPGLSVYRGGERFDDIIGQEALKEKLRYRIGGKKRLGVIVWMDEIDKALANVEQDTSGVRMYQLLKLLTKMEDNGWTGFVGVGTPGAGKSLVAKALGNEAGVPTIAVDFGATESKYVGESEANFLRLISVIESVGGGDAYFVATSNAASVMRPELQRRFTDGMWMFDLMTDLERQAAWKYYVKKYKLDAKQPYPHDAHWTGAEIRNCCRDASDLNISLVQAARTIIPMAVSRAADIEQLRLFANGRFLDANKGGHYAYTQEPMEEAVRQITLPPEVDRSAKEALGRLIVPAVLGQDDKLTRN